MKSQGHFRIQPGALFDEPYDAVCSKLGDGMLGASGSKLDSCSSPCHKSKLGAATQWQGEREAPLSISELLGPHPQSWQVLGAGVGPLLFSISGMNHTTSV